MWLEISFHDIEQHGFFIILMNTFLTLPFESLDIDKYDLIPTKNIYVHKILRQNVFQTFYTPKLILITISPEKKLKFGNGSW